MSQVATIVQQPLAPYMECPLPVQLGRGRLPPVFRAAEPMVGLPASVRRVAYALPDHDARRWLLLLVADRVESGEVVAREAVTPGQQKLVVRHFVRQASAHPVGLLAWLGALALVAIGLVRLVGALGTNNVSAGAGE